MYTEKPKRIAVLGAGAVGLSTAFQLSDLLQQNNDNSQITIIADKFTTETTSFGAAGIFRITSTVTKANSIDELKRYCANSWIFYDSVAKTAESHHAGISVLSGYQLFHEPQRLDEMVFKDVVYDFNVISPHKLTFLSNRDEFAQALSFTTLMIESRRFLPWLTARLKTSGVKFEKKRLSSLDEIADRYDCVVNCTGLGSYHLVNDHNMYPVRGQLLKVKAPWVKNFMYIGHDTYILPGIDHVSLGGTRQKDDFSLDIDPTVSTDIRKRCCQLIPTLASATLDFEWAGLRPTRDKMRVSLESIRSSSGREIPLVYNIGHGGNGIGLAMGTAKSAASFAYDAIGLHSSKL